MNNVQKIYRIKNDDFKVDQFYRPSKKLGSGAYGMVVSAKDKRDNTKVAIKKVTDCFHNLIDAKRILREIKLLQHLDHPNIVKLTDMINPISEKDFDDVYLVMECMQSDLHKIIYSENRLTNSHIAFITFQILSGLKYMHSANIIHRDLKPGNILINADCRVKICDFGLARACTEAEEDALLTEYVVTRWYRAPEVVVSAQRYDSGVDVWAVGCILAEMFLREPVFQGEDYIDQLRCIFRLIGTPEESDLENVYSQEAVSFIRRLRQREKKDFSRYFPTASEEGLDLLEKLLIFNPSKRISIDEALSHPFLQKFYDENIMEHNIFEGEALDLAFEDEVKTKTELQDAMFDEILKFRPDAPLLKKKNKKRSMFSFL